MKNILAKLKSLKQGYNEYYYNNRMINPMGEALKITIIYGIAGFLWILLSDKLLHYLVMDANVYKDIQTYKGSVYVALTMLMVYVLISKRLRLLQGAVNRINDSYDELTSTYERLRATEEKLRDQFNEVENSRNDLIESNLRYKLLVEGSKEGVWEWNKDSTYYFSIKTKDILGYEDGEIEDSYEAWESLIHPEDREATINILKNYFISKEGIYESIYRLRCKNGDYRWILSRGKALRDENGEIERMGGSHTDITEQLNLSDNLKREVILSENVMNSISVIIAIWDSKGSLLRINLFGQNILGYSEDEILGKNILDLFAPVISRDEFFATYQKVMAGHIISNLETKISTKTGKDLDLLFNVSALYKNNDEVLEIISVGTDITDRKEMEKKLHALAYYDTLTGMSNRVKFEEVVCQLIEDKECINKFAVVYMDIDNFKHINDTLGHDSGDKLLIYVSEILKNNLDEQVPRFRLGGDEFSIIFNSIDSNETVVSKIEGLLEKLRKPWVHKNQEFFVSFSIGIVIYPEHGEDYMTLLKNADTAMYCAKDKGKDDYCFYSKEMHEKAMRYIQIVNQLRYAIEKEEFILYYQPQIQLKSGKITAVEALIRWNHPEKGFISPMDFIPMAESTGQIHRITEWVLRTACKQKKEWEKKGYPPIKMSVNFSGKCFTRLNIVNDIKSLLDEMDINYKDIHIEITETAFMSDLNLVMDTANQLRAMGIKIALDDFGTGYSSLTYLKKLPIDILKMDRGFIKNINNDMEKHDEIIAQSVIQLARNLNINVVAEGIETCEQLMFLSDNGCDEVQGFYFSKPVSGESIDQLLEKNYTYKTRNLDCHNVKDIIITYDKEA